MRAILQMDAIAVVTSERFVASISGKRNRYMFASQATNEISRQHRGIAERLFERTGKLLDRFKYVWFENQLVVVGSESLRDYARKRRFVRPLGANATGRLRIRA